MLILLALLFAAAWWAAGRPGSAELASAWRSWADSPAAADAGSRSADDDPQPELEPEQQLVAPVYRRPAPEPAVETSPEVAAAIEPAEASLAAAPRTPAAGEGADAVPEPDPTLDGEPTAAAGVESAAPSGAATANRPEPPESALDDAAAALDASPRTQAAASSAPAETAGRPREELENAPEVAGNAPATASRDDSILPWELPAGLRAEFPRIEVAVHVFAPDPADRFVLVDGERYGEGDALARGVQLEEIRPRGIVVGYRNYRIRIE
ncbi:general secretion pathway protein GspB [Halomonas denitrificans]|nr:general secretion pathway protein GspB [Halomonas denitrificans]